jgi:threonyl-tRNA synthetase
MNKPLVISAFCAWMPSFGKRDMEADAVSVRVHGKGNLGAKPRSEATAEILLSIKERRS